MVTKPLSRNEMRARAITFAARWKDETSERGQSQTFWTEFLDIYGVDRKRVALFEQLAKRTSTGNYGFIDLYWPGVLIAEQKSAGDDADGSYSATDRAYWEARGTKKTVQIADEVMAIARGSGIPMELKYNKYYIGVTIDGSPENFITFRPKRTFTRLEARLPYSDALQKRYEDAGLSLMSYDQRWGYYRIELRPGDVDAKKAIISEIIKEAYDNHFKE